MDSIPDEKEIIKALGFSINEDDGAINVTRPAKDLKEAMDAFGKRFNKVTNVGPYQVSTVFLGFDHNISRLITGQGKPMLWETMVFGPKGPTDQRRYSTKRDALKGHDEVVGVYELKVSTSAGGK